MTHDERTAYLAHLAAEYGAAAHAFILNSNRRMNAGYFLHARDDLHSAIRCARAAARHALAMEARP